MSTWRITHIRNNPNAPCTIDSAVITGNVPSNGTHFFCCPECDHVHRVDIGVIAGTSINPTTLGEIDLYQCKRGRVLRGNHCTELGLTEIYVRDTEALTDIKEVEFPCPTCENTHVIAASGWITPTEIPDGIVWGEIVEDDPIVS